MFTFSALQRIRGGKLSYITSSLHLTTARSKMKLVVMVMNKNNNRHLVYLFNKRSSQALYPHRYKNRKHPSGEGNKICKLMIRQVRKKAERPLDHIHLPLSRSLLPPCPYTVHYYSSLCLL